jgi:hypothetical protein
VKIDKLQAGQRVWSVVKRKMGNTSVITTGLHPVDIIEVDPEKRWVMASWNTNPPQKYHSLSVSRWRKNKPILIESLTGRRRLASREELKAIAAGTFTGRYQR